VTTTHDAAPVRRLRLWPGVVLAGLLLIAKLVAPLIIPDATPIGVVAGPVLGVAIGIWWMFFSRAAPAERFGAMALIVLAMLVTWRFLHVSIATGMMGYMFPIFGIPIAALALVGWTVATRNLGTTVRRAALVIVILAATGGWLLVRTGGFSGYIDHDFALRWTQTAEERLLAQANDEPQAAPTAIPAAAPSATAAITPAVEIPAAAAAALAVPSKVLPAAVWPGFRGAARDGVARGVTIETDWAKSPPTEIWRRPVGPGWGSFAVAGDVLYTQEQRGRDEVVSAYSLPTGKPVWRHHDAVRFWESNGGAGPRATPTVSDGRVYALGATGLLNALEAATGAVIWSNNAAADTGAKLPEWGFSGSPLVVDDIVVVATGGVLAAYDARTGTRRWIGPQADEGYTSPQLATIGGVKQILLMSGTGLASVTPADGKPLWQHDWKGYPIVQPSPTADNGVLIAANESSGTRRLAVAHGANGWTAEERWTSNRLKPWFNDFVVHKGHAYGFDGTILACMDLADGGRKWKGGRYGGGQLVLLPDQDALLVISEEGELALVSATPDAFKELGRAPAIHGKTWNHPVIAGNLLLVRNGEEMAAFRLAAADRSKR
jgi:outer membrane protein assembly factor BamB